MRIELRQDKVLIDGYVNAVARDSRPISGESGGKFIEQIMPGAFTKALERAKASGRAIELLLNHDRKVGDTNTNLQLIEDNIGLRAICEVTDAEVVKEAREGKLQGWSFGFTNARAQEEDVSENMKRRFVEDMDLIEVSLIDDRKTPCYAGTSINTRADATTETVETRSLDIVGATITDSAAAMEQLKQYRARINELSEKEN